VRGLSSGRRGRSARRTQTRFQLLSRLKTSINLTDKHVINNNIHHCVNIITIEHFVPHRGLYNGHNLRGTHAETHFVPILARYKIHNYGMGTSLAELTGLSTGWEVRTL
jgi:hypothetical protein